MNPSMSWSFKPDRPVSRTTPHRRCKRAILIPLWHAMEQHAIAIPDRKKIRLSRLKIYHGSVLIVPYLSTTKDEPITLPLSDRRSLPRPNVELSDLIQAGHPAVYTYGRSVIHAQSALVWISHGSIRTVFVISVHTSIPL